VVRADPGRVLVVDVGDPAVLEDVNTPEDYRALDDA
jgi:CTP:molybdopterin cytidylyltransferase MocA